MSGKTATTANYWAITVPGRDVHQDGQGAEFVVRLRGLALLFMPNTTPRSLTATRRQRGTRSTRFCRGTHALSGWTSKSARRTRATTCCRVCRRCPRSSGSSGYALVSIRPRWKIKQPWIQVDHKSTEFLDDRQAQLQFYMQKLARIPGIENVPAFITFITSNGTSEQVGKSSYFLFILDTRFHAHQLMPRLL